MRISRILLAMGFMMFSPFLMAENKDAMPESCVKLVAALEACEEGPEGPFGSVRKACNSSAKSEYKCNLPVKEVRKRLKKK